MPDDLSQTKEKLVGKAHVSKTKTDGLKKGPRKQQLLLSAKKKEYVSKHLTAPNELISFLQADETLEKVLEGGDSTMLRLIICIYIQLQPRFLMCYLVYTMELSARGGSGQHDSDGVEGC